MALIEVNKNEFFGRWESDLKIGDKSSKLYFEFETIFYENKLVTNFKEETKLFNSQFTTQSSFINNNRKLLSHIQYLSDNRLSSASCFQDKIANII